ncbi:hypothetical protein [Planococcus sp. S3-L1]|uniref:hypothetical protein n=1 Tax=Planococcus sp. S3-L1 TaxID=3046200 RepID=UPI0024BB5BA9|nr:hypothetical protein [Planococcus sp. S3-L1]MDJ0331129.1 hypothetical protein [Planococcus sp. S3-L1]
MTLIDEVTLTEYEAILLTMEHGFEGNELNSKRWIKNSSLDGTIDKVTGEYADRAIIALINKLKTFYDFVQVKGKGKSRRYILSGKKEQQTERVFNYTSFASSPEGNIMIEYVFNQLLDIKENDISISNWTRLIGLPNVSNYSMENAIEEMTDLYSGNLGDNTEKIIGKAIDEINSTIRSRNMEIVKTAFSHLKKQKRIKTTSIFCLRKVEGNVQVINQEEYKKVKSDIKTLVEEQEVVFKDYMNARRYNNFYTKELRECNRIVKKHLNSQGIDFEFERLSVKVINDEMKTKVTGQEINRTWCDDFIKLTQNKQRKEKYRDSQYLTKEFYLLNVCIMLKSYLSKSQLSIIEMETIDMNKRFNLMKDRYIENKLLEDEIKARPIGFGQTIEHTA